MSNKRVVHTDALLSLNPDFANALFRGESWAREHMRVCESLNAGEPEGFRRPFDGTARRWCGAACPFDDGCVTCTLPENADMARSNREVRNRTERVRNGAVLIEGYVDNAMVVRVKEMIQRALVQNPTTLDVIIESRGGLVPSGMQIFDLIRNAPVRKRIGTVPRYALSMAAIILQACDERVASPEAEILMHHTRFSEVTIETLRNRSAVEAIVALCEPDEQRMDAILVARTGRTRAEIKALNDRDEKMTSVEALAFGLIDAIEA